MKGKGGFKQTVLQEYINEKSPVTSEVTVYYCFRTLSVQVIKIKKNHWIVSKHLTGTVCQSVSRPAYLTVLVCHKWILDLHQCTIGAIAVLPRDIFDWWTLFITPAFLVLPFLWWSFLYNQVCALLQLEFCGLAINLIGTEKKQESNLFSASFFYFFNYLSYTLYQTWEWLLLSDVG